MSARLHRPEARSPRAVVAAILLVLGAAASASRPAAAESREAAPVLAEVPGLGPVLLHGSNPRKAALDFVAHLRRSNAYPGDHAALQRWARRQGSNTRWASVRGNGPVIGIQLNRSGDLSGAEISDKTRAVVRGIRKAGGVVVLLPPAYHRQRIPSLIRHVDHLVLLGGDDIDPSLYGQKKTHARDVNRVVDRYEQAVVRSAMSRQVRVMGICRGCQNLAVANGGKLAQDIRKDGVSARPHGGWNGARVSVEKHPVTLQRGSGAASTFGDGKLSSVVSMHHQAIVDPGPGARVTGRSPDGVPEIIEGPKNRFRGYQFHPELVQAQLDKVARDVVQEARKRARRRVDHLRRAQRRGQRVPHLGRRHRAVQQRRSTTRERQRRARQQARGARIRGRR